MHFQASKLFLFASVLAPSLLASPISFLVEGNSTITSFTQFVTLAEVSKERYCHVNLHYCGWNLINNYNEDYHTRISNRLCKVIGDCNFWSGNVWNSLWNCGNDLEFLGICGGENSCRDGGSGRHDYCKA
ncbi:hypothetical protein BCIN_14g04030 [Botrytis cinerea B05.10]|uniref:Uncharacterized protein n=1 Tax=Botryotinia fuckeliana (strain B05.10) TaxID=332648 RepID=A0A384K3Y1_BOTFB|nr:hypothetical protein BCIN_14g04030 [Botrytis cinerea B05.10]ATZ57247.1 hypothetical protein BCIN_14g04030 [Botrytis cinerea B05.10]